MASPAEWKALNKPRRSPPYKMFQQSQTTRMSARSLNVSPMRLLSGGSTAHNSPLGTSSRGLTSSPSKRGLGSELDDNMMMEVRLDNHLDDLPASEELKMNIHHNSPRSRKFCRRLMMALVAIVLIVVCIALMVVYLSPKSSSSSSLRHQGGGSSVGTTHTSRPSELHEIIAFLLDDVDPQTLGNTSTPQYLAAKWIAEEDPRAPSSVVDHSFYQRYALAVLWFATATNGTHPWNHDLHFMSDKHECDWNAPYKRYDLSTFPMGIQCNENKEISSISLQTIGLHGSVPSELRLITTLSSLSLDRNEITNMDGIKDLKQLEYLTMGYNQFRNSAVPSWLGDLTRLTTLGLSSNGFVSSLPAELANLTSLDTLLLDGNELTGDLGVLERMQSLTKIFLHRNFFTGTLDNSFLQELHGLEVLNLADNYLEGHLGRGLLRRSNLQILDLHANDMAGTLPADMPHSTSLRLLALEKNLFTGPIPSTLNHLANLQHLDLSVNRLDGTIPDDGSLAQLTTLEYLSLGENPLLTPGPFPTFLQNLTRMKHLSLKATSRTGTIPSWISTRNEKLIVLDLDNNAFNSSIPQELGNLKNLSYLLLNSNNLQGNIPPSMSRLSRLKLLLLQKNSLDGSLDALCPLKVPVLVADCSEEVQCDCCSHCCRDDAVDFNPQPLQQGNNGGEAATCPDLEWLARLNPYWESRYRKDMFQFVADVISVPEGGDL